MAIDIIGSYRKWSLLTAPPIILGGIVGTVIVCDFLFRKTVPDEAVTKCTSCGTDFSAFVRKHHCRNCGDIFCDKCTHGRIALTTDENAPQVRVCDRCMAEVTHRLSNTKEADSRSAALKSHEDLAKKLQHYGLYGSFQQRNPPCFGTNRQPHEKRGGVELVESASCYRMITQMELLKFLKESNSADHELQAIMSRSVSELGAMSDHIFGVTDRTKVIDSIKFMRAASLNAVPIVQAFNTSEEDHMLPVDGKGRRLVGTFSATDLRGCPISQLRYWLPISVMEFTEKLSLNPPRVASAPASRGLVTCHAESLLSEVVDKAVTKHVHRVWVVDRMGLLVGLVSLTDIIRVIRADLDQGD